MFGLSVNKTENKKCTEKNANAALLFGVSHAQSNTSSHRIDWRSCYGRTRSTHRERIQRMGEGEERMRVIECMRFTHFNSNETSNKRSNSNSLSIWFVHSLHRMPYFAVCVRVCVCVFNVRVYIQIVRSSYTKDHISYEFVSDNCDAGFSKELQNDYKITICNGKKRC